MATFKTQDRESEARAGAMQGLIHVTIPALDSGFGNLHGWRALTKCRLVQAKCIFTTAGASGSVKLHRCQGTEDAEAGDELLVAGMALNGTEDTGVSGVLADSLLLGTYDFEAGNRLGIQEVGTTTGLVGLLIDCIFMPVPDTQHTIQP